MGQLANSIFQDTHAGEFSKHGRTGSFFENVRITSYDAVCWGKDLDLCSDALYMELTGKNLEELLAVQEKFVSSV